MNEYDELIEHCRNMHKLGFGKMDAVADALEHLDKKCKSYEGAIEALASMEHFYPDGTKFYITSENVMEKEVALRLKIVKQQDAAIKRNLASKIKNMDACDMANEIFKIALMVCKQPNFNTDTEQTLYQNTVLNNILQLLTK